MIDLTKFLEEVITVKVASGEEIIGRIGSINDNEITIDEPLSVAPGPQGIGLMPTLFTAEGGSTVIINRSSIVMVAMTAEQVRSKYIEATTGIQTPSKKLILG